MGVEKCKGEHFWDLKGSKLHLIISLRGEGAFVRSFGIKFTLDKQPKKSKKGGGTGVEKMQITLDYWPKQ